MSVKIKLDPINNLKENILDNIKKSDCNIDSEADFFLGILMQNIEKKVLKDKPKVKELKLKSSRTTSFNISIEPHKKDSVLKGHAKRSLSTHHGLAHNITPSQGALHIYNPGNKLDDAIQLFSKELVKNAEKGEITSKSIYNTMKSICPLWPFC